MSREGVVDDRSRVALATMAGAVLGGLFGYLYLTEQGQRLREQIDPMLDELTGELQRVRGTVDRAREAALEGRRTFDDLFGSAARASSWESRARQASS